MHPGSQHTSQFDPRSGSAGPTSSSRAEESLSVKDQAIQQDRRFFGHPVPLLYTFSLEFWERFSFYGLQAILAIYIYYSVAEGGLNQPEAVAVGLVAAYGGIVYVSTLLGAWVSDRLLGAERTIFLSAVIVVIGHVTLALAPGLPPLLIALLLTAVGAGGVKANAAAIVGMLYSPTSGRKDAGFVIYYMSITIGALVGPILTGFAQSSLGFHYGFGLAAIGMSSGLIIYLFTKKKLPDLARRVPSRLPRNKRWAPIISTLVVGIALALLVLTGALTLGNVSQWLTAVSLAMIVILYVLFLRSRKVTSPERKSLMAFIPVLVCTAIFMSLHFQVFGVLITYADSSTNRMIGSWQMPVAWTVTIYSVMITVAAPFLSGLWTKLGARQPSSSRKLALGLLFVGTAFLLFIPFANADTPNSTPLIWLALSLFLIGIGELLVGPVGVSLATTVAPKAFRAQMIGVYYLSIALGSALSGVFGQFYNPADQLPYWTAMGALGVIAGLLQMAIAPRMTRIMSTRV